MIFFSIFKIIFLIFRHIYKLSKEKSATFNWLILLCECVDSRGPFLESSNNWRARKAVVAYMQNRGFNSFASNIIKLLVNEAKWSSFLARTRALILFISTGTFEKLGVHACPWGQRYHVTRFSGWRTTLSVIQIPAGKYVQMKAWLIYWQS